MIIPRRPFNILHLALPIYASNESSQSSDVCDSFDRSNTTDFEQTTKPQNANENLSDSSIFDFGLPNDSSTSQSEFIDTALEQVNIFYDTFNLQSSEHSQAKFLLKELLDAFKNPNIEKNEDVLIGNYSKELFEVLNLNLRIFESLLVEVQQIAEEKLTNSQDKELKLKLEQFLIFYIKALKLSIFDTNKNIKNLISSLIENYSDQKLIYSTETIFEILSYSEYLFALKNLDDFSNISKELDLLTKESDKYYKMLRDNNEFSRFNFQLNEAFNINQSKSSNPHEQLKLYEKSAEKKLLKNTSGVHEKLNSIVLKLINEFNDLITNKQKEFTKLREEFDSSALKIPYERYKGLEFQRKLIKINDCLDHLIHEFVTLKPIACKKLDLSEINSIIHQIEKGGFDFETKFESAQTREKIEQLNKKKSLIDKILDIFHSMSKVDPNEQNGYAEILNSFQKMKDSYSEDNMNQIKNYLNENKLFLANKIADLNSNIEELSNDIYSYAEKIRENANEIEKLKSENADLNAEIVESKVELKKYEKGFEKETEMLNEMLQFLDNQLRQTENHIFYALQTKEAETKFSNKLIEAKIAEIEAVKAKISSLESRSSNNSNNKGIKAKTIFIHSSIIAISAALTALISIYAFQNKIT